ncbi:MAG: GntR family transcriptional regulator [Bacteroidales bacterium]|nr:GntR family transcriptional regulator [Bacteroidales bacterium]
MNTKNNKKPLHLQAEEAIKEMIASPEFQNGKLLPNELELAKSLNISRNTLRQAINKLVFEGLLCRKKGYGTWAVKKTVTSGVKNWMSFSQEMQQLGIKVKNYELHVSTEVPAESVLAFFGKDSSTEQYCLKLERVRGDMDAPFVVFISWFNPAINMDGDDNFSKPLYELLENKYGVIVNTSIEEISARLAGKQIGSKLRISENDPILIRKRFVYDINMVPIEYNIGYYKADSFTYTITAER